MGQPIACLGDTSSHGGQIVTASGTFSVMGQPVARVGDRFDCPKHGKQTIVSGSSTHLDEGKPVAHVGSQVSCGAVITSGNASFTIGD